MQRLGRLSLLVRSFTHSLTNKRADKVPEKLTRAVVVLTGKLGDVVCGTPVLRALKKHYPNIHIAVAGNTSTQKPVLEHSGLVDEYIDLDRKDAVVKVKAGNFQAGFITGPSFSSVAKLYLAGVPLVVAPDVVGGTSPAVTKLYRAIKTLIVTFPYHIGAYAPRERLRALESVGIVTDDTTKQLGFSKEAEVRVNAFLNENRLPDDSILIGISPTAGNKIKEWPEVRFAEVADHLMAKYKVNVIVVGGPTDKERVSKTISQIKEKGATGVNRFSVDELKAFISKLKLFIAVDTGPIYIAEAFGVPTIDIVGPVDENVQPPQGPRHINVVPPYKRKPQLSILNARAYDKVEAIRQTLSITSEMVNQAIDKLMPLI